MSDTLYQINLLTDLAHPQLELINNMGETRTLPFQPIGDGRFPGERRWRAACELDLNREWRFRVRGGEERRIYLTPRSAEYYALSRPELWIQDDHVFDYEPTASLSSSYVLKIPEFFGSLPSRPLYVYLPRGYEAHQDRTYPVLYMHDGQNIFERYVEDSYAGSWRADLIADQMIQEGEIRECIIVGVGHGGANRIVEYLPPYSSFPPAVPDRTDGNEDLTRPGHAHKTVMYYKHSVAPYLRENFRVATDREDTAMCGSSMGGLFSLYFAWHAPEFAGRFAALSTSFWITKREDGRLEMLDRLRQMPDQPINLWLDSGTYASHQSGNDGQDETRLARDILVETGFVEGENLNYYLDEGATHSEEAWARRLPKIFRYLFPLNNS